MYFSRPEIIVRIKKDVLEFYIPPTNQLQKLEIPSYILNYQDVINEVYFLQFLSDFLVKLKIPSASAKIVLDNEIIYSSIVAKVNETQDKSAIDSFISNIPFDQKKIAYQSYLSNNQFYIYATNSDFFNLLITALKKVGWSVKYVVPLIIFGINTQDEALNEENLKIIKNSKDIAQKVNFLDKNLPRTK